MTVNHDVNAAALGEFRWGASQGLDPSLYLTIGTGIGGGYIKDGKPLIWDASSGDGTHPPPARLETGSVSRRLSIPRRLLRRIASGPAIEKRFGARGETIRDDDPFWNIEADYIASALSTYILTLSPKRIILGGGIMQHAYLFPLVRRKVLELLNGYVESESLLKKIDEYIVPPFLGSRSGSLGAIALAQGAG